MTVYTLETLDDAVSGPKPAKLAVIGWPVKHSASPRMHQPALDEAGIEASYIALEVEPGHVAEAFAKMRELGFIGCNVTVPHKFDAMAACDEIDDAAKRLGAVNTVSFEDDATLGTNTDGYGFEHAVLEDMDIRLKGTTMMIVGAGGGAGGAIAAHSASCGVTKLVLANRTLSKLDELTDSLQVQYPQLKLITCGTDDSDLLASLAADCELLVNTSSLGLKEDDPSPLPEECFNSSHAVFDSIYQPPRTAFLMAAEKAGARITNGQSMLLHQGVNAFTTWFPDTEPTAAMRKGLG